MRSRIRGFVLISVFVVAYLLVSYALGTVALASLITGWTPILT